MTPIVKAYLTDMGSEVANLAVQVYGGYGYIKDYGVEQYVRDARIAQIYEGTNGVQALDLIGRKLPFANGRYLRAFFHPAQAFIEEHQNNPAMAEFIKPLVKHLGYLQQGTIYIVTAGLKNPEDAAAGATEYLRISRCWSSPGFGQSRRRLHSKNATPTRRSTTPRLPRRDFISRACCPEPYRCCSRLCLAPNRWRARWRKKDFSFSRKAGEGCAGLAAAAALAGAR